MGIQPQPTSIGHSAPSERLINEAASSRRCRRARRPLTTQERADWLLMQWQLQRDLPPSERRLIDALVSP